MVELDKNFEERQQYAQPKKSFGCMNCFGCFGGCVFAAIVLFVLGFFGMWYVVDNYGRDMMADQIDNLADKAINETMSDETLKASLKSNIKDFTTKIRNKEIGLTTVMDNTREIKASGIPIKFVLFGLYGESLATGTEITSEEQKNLQQVIYGLRKNDIEIRQLASFTEMVSEAQERDIDAKGGKKINKEKLHKALDELKKLVTVNKLEDPGSNFNLEEIITTEVNRFIKILKDGKDNITGKAAQKIMKDMESTSSEE